MPVFLIIQVIVSVGLIRTEWRSGTAGWWLALPYTRTLSPVAGLSGILLGVVSQSRWKKALPLFLVGVWFLGNALVPWGILVGLNYMTNMKFPPAYSFLDNYGILAALILVVPAVVAYGLYRLSAHVLEQKVEL